MKLFSFAFSKDIKKGREILVISICLYILIIHGSLLLLDRKYFFKLSFCYILERCRVFFFDNTPLWFYNKLKC